MSQKRWTRLVSHLLSPCRQVHRTSRPEWAAGVVEVYHLLEMVARTMVAVTGAEAEGMAIRLEGQAVVAQAVMAQEGTHGRIMLA